MRYPFAKMYKLGLILLYAGACFGASNNRGIGEHAAVGETPTNVTYEYYEPKRIAEMSLLGEGERH